MSSRRTVSVMGDGGFWHNGLLSGVASNLLNKGDGVLVIMKNGYASATGTQELISSPPEAARTEAEGRSSAHADRTIEDTLTGLGGIAVTIWCQMRGGPKDKQRAVFQPVMFATFVLSAITLGIAGTYTLETMKLYLLALPVLGAGLWCGIHLYGKLDDTGFRRVLLILLLAAGFSLVVPQLVRSANALLAA